MKCVITATKTKVKFQILNKNLEVTSNPLNCSDSLSPLKYEVNPIPFYSGSEVQIGKGYTSFFSHSKKDECAIEKCELMTEDCSENKLMSEI